MYLANGCSCWTLQQDIPLKKRLLSSARSVARSAELTDTDPVLRIDEEDDTLIYPQGNIIFDLWDGWKKGILPEAGGMLDQDLETMNQIYLMDLTYNTYKYMDSEGADLNTLSADQKLIINWISEDDER